MSDKDKADPSVQESQPAEETQSEAETVAEESEEENNSPEARVAELEKQLAQMQDKLLRTRADFDNYRKRMQREISDARVAAKTGAIEDILPVLDHFQMAMEHANEQTDFQTLKQGMDMIGAEFRRIFESMGVTTISTAGQQFDPNLHEAISMEPSDDVPEGVILREWKSGYQLGDRILRAPSVIVSSGPAADSTDDND